MPSIDQLNADFALDDALTFEPGGGNLPRMHIETPTCRAEAYLHGAHVTRWLPSGHDEVLWLSDRALFQPDKPIRGGVPLCFPWFAGHKPKNQPNAPSHGYARTTAWEVAATAWDGDDVVVAFTAPIAPCWALRYTVTFGQALSLRLEATNSGECDAAFEVALHSYFTVSQIRQVQVTGRNGATYENPVGGAGTTHTQGDAPLTFAAETDFIYATPNGCTIHDPGLSREITIEKSGSESTVVWNPWDAKARAMSDFGDDEWPGMMCVEPANIAPHTVTVAPGETDTTAATIRVE